MVPRSAATGVKPGAAPRALPALPPPPQSSALSKLGVPFLYGFLFLAYSRVADFTVGFLHLPIILATLAVIFAVMNRGLVSMFASRIGIALACFTAWLLVTTPLSFWRGGSADVVVNSWGKSLMVFFMIAGLVQTLRQCRRAMYTLAGSTLFVTAMAFLFSRRSGGRLELPSGLLNNPNDMAQILLIGLPFWLLLAINENQVPFRRVLASACIGVIVIAVAHTGSRGGFVALALLGFFVFRSVSLAGKVKLALAGVALVLLGVALIPESVAGRYTAIFDSTPNLAYEDEEIRTIESTWQRWALLKDSIKLTLLHPVFGVGPGQFQSFSAKEAGTEGKPAMWRETHCMYTQVSSETGLPGLFFYMAALLFSLYGNGLIYKRCRGRRELADVSTTAYALILSLLGFAITSLFSSVAYAMFFPTLAGLSAAFSRIAKAEIASRTSAPAPAVPAAPARLPRNLRARTVTAV